MSGRAIRYGIWLAGCVGSRPGAYGALISEYGSAEAVHRADHTKRKSGGPVSRGVIRALCDKDLTEAERIADYCAMKHITVLLPSDEKYPALLRDLPDLPAVLYVLGKLPDFSLLPATAVVGTREMTEYGMQVAYSVGYGLARGGSVVVSGMAAGGDSLALCGALDAGGIPVAVLGCGVDRAYPVGNAGLMREIAARGAVISEYPPGTQINRQNFPERNRIISGLSRAVCVTEGDTRSGALITARRAREQVRQVFAVPGNVGVKGSGGVNLLLKENAALLTSVDDVLRNYAFLYPDAITLGIDDAVDLERARASAEAHAVDVGRILKNSREKAKKNELETDEMPFVRIKAAESDINMTEEEPVSDEELSLIDSRTREIFLSLPDGPFLPDEAVSGKYDVADIMCALTVLEINSLVRSVPGGRYLARKRNCK
ncbi:MAG: DNA-processing protein DprA [Clostridia bacterium]|nr:DNA-processing protein DprA [Clostridia bacterium]